MTEENQKIPRGVRLAVIGDLHFEEKDKQMYEKAREQILFHEPDALAQLGDLGGYTHPGSSLSFNEGKNFLSSFKKPYYPLIGNHDLEGEEYNSDEQVTQAWCNTFDLPNPYYLVDLDHTLLIFLSSIHHRDNHGSCHEVHLGRKQLEWFKEVAYQNKKKPIYVFSHAPILGSKLRVLQNLHLKVPNAWINHTNNPEELIKIVQENPQIKLWFSGHNHLGQYYQDSITQVESCFFIHTGVISSISRDKCHHSRLIEFGSQGCLVSTLDHDSGQCNVDLSYEFEPKHTEIYTKFIEEKENNHYFPPPPFPEDSNLVLNKSTFTIHRNMLVEFDTETKAPIGIVDDNMKEKKVCIEQNHLIIKDRGKEKIVLPEIANRYQRIYYKNRRVSKPL